MRTARKQSTHSPVASGSFWSTCQTAEGLLTCDQSYCALTAPNTSKNLSHCGKSSPPGHPQSTIPMPRCTEKKLTDSLWKEKKLNRSTCPLRCSKSQYINYDDSKKNKMKKIVPPKFYFFCPPPPKF